MIYRLAAGKNNVGTDKLKVMKKLGTVLLIDDDNICNYLNQQILEGMQVFRSIVCLTDYEEVLAYLQKAFASTAEAPELRPDLIFLDLNMPGLDGFQVLQQLNAMSGSKDLSKKRVVILSSSMLRMDQDRAIKYGIFDYLVKPLTKTKVKRVIERFLQNQPSDSASRKKSLNPHELTDRPSAARPSAESRRKKREQED